MGNANLTGQYARWSMIPQEYDFAVHHQAGKRHQNADHLNCSSEANIMLDTWTALVHTHRRNRDDDPPPLL